MTKTTQHTSPSMQVVATNPTAEPLTGDRWGQDGLFTPEQLAKLTPEQLIAYACGTQIVRAVVPDELTFRYDTINAKQPTE